MTLVGFHIFPCCLCPARNGPLNRRQQSGCLAITFSGFIRDMQQVRLLRVGIVDDLVDNRAMRSASAYRRHLD